MSKTSIIIEIDLGNEAMLTALDVSNAVESALDVGYDAALKVGMGGVVRDTNGNGVGVWRVEEIEVES